MYDGMNIESGSLTSQAMAGFFSRMDDSNPDAETRQTIIDRARYLNTVSTTARSLHDCLTRAVIGAGVRYEYPKDSDFFDYTDSRIKDAWNRVSHTRCLDARRRLTLTQLEQLVFTTMIVSGECWLFRKGRSWIVKEPDCIKTPAEFVTYTDRTVTTDEGHIITDGIELDDGIPVACYFVEKVDGVETYERIPFIGDDGLPQVLQVFMQERPEQVRGLPLTSPVIPQLWACLAYSDSETQMAMLQTNMSLIITTNTNPTTNPFSGLTVRDLDSPLIPPQDGEKTGSNDFSWIPPQGDSAFYGLIDKAHYIKPGQTRHLSEGEDIKFVSPTSPHTGFTDFCNFMIRGIGSAVGIPYQVLTGTYDANFSAVKGAVSAFNHTVRRYRKVFIEQFLKPVFEVFLTDFIQDRDVLELVAMESQWLPNDSPLTLDPTREMDFYLKAVNAGLISRDEAAEAMFGHKASGDVQQAKTLEKELI